VKVRHRLEGPGSTTLVLSGSLGTTLELWDSTVPSWESLRLLRYDHRGHGRSAVPPGPYSVDELGRDVLELLDELDLERVSFCGLSLGGAVGLWLAANAPTRIDRLVLASTSARFGDAEPWLERAATVRAEGLEAVADSVLARWFTPSFAADRPGLVARHREMLVATPAEGYAACCEAIAGWDFRERLSEVAAPTLVIAAAEDPATPPEHGRLLAERIPGAELVIVPRVAHLANIEQPETFAALVGGHLGSWARAPVATEGAA
jgi:3-oxoadipate enol-lactonase